MYPRSFNYIAPHSLDEAVEALGVYEDAKALAGGMSLIPMMKLRVLSPTTVVDLGRIPGLDRITADGAIRIPALARHREVAADPMVRRHAPALAEAAAWTGDPQVRVRGTACGSVAHADPAGDQPAAVLALDAMIETRSPRGVRNIPAGDFFVDMFTTALQPDELIERITLPLAGPGESSAYVKIGRRGSPDGFPIVGVAVWLRIIEDRIAEARVALTGLSFRPIESPVMAASLVGSRGSDAEIAAAAETVADGVTILADVHGSEEYKNHLVTSVARRAVQRALERAADPDR